MAKKIFVCKKLFYLIIVFSIRIKKGNNSRKSPGFCKNFCVINAVGVFFNNNVFVSVFVLKN